MKSRMEVCQRVVGEIRSSGRRGGLIVLTMRPDGAITTKSGSDEETRINEDARVIKLTLNSKQAVLKRLRVVSGSCRGQS